MVQKGVQEETYPYRRYIQEIISLVPELDVLTFPWLVVYDLRGAFDFVSCVRCDMLRSILLYLYLRRRCLISLCGILDIGSIPRDTFLFLAVRGVEWGCTIHHCKVGDGLIANGTVVHAVTAYWISFAVKVDVHVDVEETVAGDTMETRSVERGRWIPCRMPAFVIEQYYLSFVN
jgi:hypothetical protein